MKYSVVIPAYNVAPYISQCLESVLLAAKTSIREDVEIVVIDDCSTDETSNIIARFSEVAKIPFKSLKHNINRGLAASRNTGVANASGEYVLLLDADNLVHEQVFAYMDKQMKCSPDVDVFILGMELIDDQGRNIGHFYRDRVNVDVGPNATQKSVLLLQQNFMDSFSLARKSVLANNPYDEHLRSLEDWDLWIRLLWIRNSKFKFVAEQLGSYRIRENSLTQDLTRNTVSYCAAVLPIYCKIILNSELMQLPGPYRAQITNHIRQLCLAIVSQDGISY